MPRKRIDLRDIITFGAMGMIFAGGWMLAGPALALVTTGLCLFLLGIASIG